MKRSYIIGTIALGLLCASGTAAEAADLQAGIGLEYSSGEYGGTNSVDVVEVPFSARLKVGDWSFRARIPYAHIDGGLGVSLSGDDAGIEDRCGSNSGSGSSSSGSGSGSGSGSNSGSGSSGSGSDDDEICIGNAATLVDSKRSGFGDATLSAAYAFSFSDALYMDLTGRVTLPTGDEDKSLGVGETDYALSAELGHDSDFGGAYVGAGYRHRGGSNRKDGPSATLGAYKRLGETVIVGGEGSWSQAARDGADDPASAAAYLSLGVTKNVRMSLFAEAGLSDAAPDFAGGASFTWRPNFRRPFQPN